MWKIKVHHYHHGLEVLNEIKIKLRRMENRIMGRITDVTDRFESLVGEAVAEINLEIQQLKDAIVAGDQTEANAAADRLSAMGDNLQSAVDALKGDNPAPAPEPTPEPAPETPPVEG